MSLLVATLIGDYWRTMMAVEMKERRKKWASLRSCWLALDEEAVKIAVWFPFWYQLQWQLSAPFAKLVCMGADGQGQTGRSWLICWKGLCLDV